MMYSSEHSRVRLYTWTRYVSADWGRGEETKERQRINFTDKTHVLLKTPAVENSHMWRWYRKRIIDDDKSFKDVWELAFFYKLMSFSSEINNNHLCPSILCNWRRHHCIVPCGPASCNKQFPGRGWSGSELHGIWLCIGPLWIWNMRARVRANWQKHKHAWAVRDGMALTQNSHIEHPVQSNPVFFTHSASNDFLFPRPLSS